MLRNPKYSLASGSSLWGHWPYYLVTASISLYVVFFIFGRAYHFWVAWGRFTTAYNGQAHMHSLCETSHETHTTAADICNYAREYIQTGPVLRALEDVRTGLKLCGDYHCSDILLYIMESWAGLAFLVSFSFWAAWWMFQRSDLRGSLFPTPAAPAIVSKPDYMQPIAPGVTIEEMEQKAHVLMDNPKTEQQGKLLMDQVRNQRLYDKNTAIQWYEINS